MQSGVKNLNQNFYIQEVVRGITDCNGIPTNNYLVHKRRLNHLAKLTIFGQFG